MKKSTALNTLGLSEGATDDEIKKAHRKLIIENHPDKFGQDAAARAKAEEKTKLINEARDVLLNRSWEPEYASAGTPFGTPYSYDPFAATREGTRSTSQGSRSTGAGSEYHNPFDEWPFTEFVWTAWDASGEQYTYRNDGSQANNKGNPFGGNPYSKGNPFEADSNPFTSQGSNPFTNSGQSNPFDSRQSSFGNSFFDFSDFFQAPTKEEKLKRAKADLSFDIKLVITKLAILALCMLLSAPATGLYLYTIISIGQGIWKRLNFLSLIFVIPFTMLAIIFVPNSNTTIGIFALILFLCSVGFDISNIRRHTQRIHEIKRQ